ncbi:AAA family ATPase [Alteromonas sp. BMJM2]|uniref:AAA family ATPase n=1 Tax=Alteromonas sp. BMJM2 TaxID=2954241 RepID=UPI0022B2B007|nr:AAA family ATPase [Alteromonas sp. BMJM2]
MLKHREELDRIFSIFVSSKAEIRPHFIFTGPSGSGKTFTIAQLAEKHGVNFLEINAAQLTKEGTSGNSLSKALVPLANMQLGQTVIFVDEFDKLFISGNSNSELAHETTNGVQNEFLKILESDTTSVFGDYGKYINIPCKNVLFIFAGAFNGEENIDLDRLREIGLKTEFLGRVGLAYNTDKIALEDLIQAMKDSELLAMYLELFPKIKRKDVERSVTDSLTEGYENNTLGYRAITTLLHQYFINGGPTTKQKQKAMFSKTLEFRSAS